MPKNFVFMGRKNFISKKWPKTGLFGNFLEFLLKKNSCEIDSMGSSVLHFCCQDELPMPILGPFFTIKIFSTHKRKVVGHEKLVNIGPSDQVFIGGKVVLIPNNPAEESQVISF